MALTFTFAPATSSALDCGAENQKACTVFQRVPSCDPNLVESAGKCVHPPCGRQGQNACTVVQRIPSCDTGLQEIRGKCVPPTPCGAEGQRACLVVERVPSCNKNLVESGGSCVHPPCGRQGQNACTVNVRIPSCDDDLKEVSGKCVSPTPCGGEGQRACLVVERVPSCDPYLVESNGSCRHPACGRLNERPCTVAERIPSCDINLSEVAGKCIVPGPSVKPGPVKTTVACGREGGRPCTVAERIPSCDPNLVESKGLCVHPPCGRLNDRACTVAERIPSCDTALVESKGRCLSNTPCGGEGQRACLVTERIPSCNANLVETKSGCVHPACGRANERACTVTERVPSCDTNLVEAKGKCIASCGADGQRACTVVERVPSCNTNLVEVAGKCTALACGAAGQRACTLRERVPSCNQGLVEIPGCTGECLGSSGMCADLKAPLVEPTINATVLPATNPMRGYADVHVHMFSHLAFGGGVLAGQPYDKVLGIKGALAPDYGTNSELVDLFGRTLPPVKCPATQPSCGRVILHGDHTPIDDSAGAGTDDGTHSNFGAPLFNGWPTWHTTTHQQVYYKWLERAWRGGLRLMTMLAVNNEVLCKTSKRVRNTDCEDAMKAVDAQLDAAYEFQRWLDAQPGGGWFKIVKDPAEAEAVIRNGKLAVVLGIEVDSLFNCKLSGKCTPASVLADVDKYYAKGVRHVYPTHNFDGGFSGTAVWMNLLNTGNRIIEKQWYAVEPCDTSDFVLSATVPTVATIPANLIEGNSVPYPQYPKKPTCNVKGLTPLGRTLISRLMEKGMLIDIDHMSAKSIDETIEMAKARPGGYPLMAGHGLFADLYKDTRKRHERMRTAAQIDAIKKLGGLVSIMTQDEMDDERDCKHSSRSFATNLRYISQRISAVPFGSDFNGLAPHVGPRYGDDACGKDKVQRQAENARPRLEYPFTLPGFGVFYRQVTGQRTFDFNTDGLAHIGLFPDLIRDLMLNGVDVEPLMRSADAYVQAWKRATKK
ncbi:MAG: hypothetical protein BGO98_17865 [Myxococcales bacterium 68-20]|nr:MAG: hypothetical protein BGO98_17865 [Myxococcales bacterium 68-20]